MNIEPHLEITYADKVGLALESLPVGEAFDVEKKVKPENKAMFIEVVKSYIDRNMGRQDGWYLQPTTGWKSIRKESIISKITQLAHHK